MKYFITLTMLLSFNSYAHDIEDKNLLEACIKTSTMLKQVCSVPKLDAKSAKENYDADRSIDNLKKMLSTQKELIKCYTAYNIGCVASLKSSLKDDY